jgi:hypothetical protein
LILSYNEKSGLETPLEIFQPEQAKPEHQRTKVIKSCTASIFIFLIFFGMMECLCPQNTQKGTEKEKLIKITVNF